MRPAGGNHRTLKLLARRLGVPTDHFDPHAVQRDVLRAVSRPIPLEQILVRGSNYNRHNLKLRLYGTGLKQRACEMCGQGELWRGRRMSLILDHINGEATDNRLENLRIVCPNCAATLDTHCGKALRRPRTARTCQAAAPCSSPTTARSDIARTTATPSRRPASRSRSAASSSARRSRSSSPRSRPRAGARSGAAMASPTTPCASGCGSTTASAPRPRTVRPSRAGGSPSASVRGRPGTCRRTRQGTRSRRRSPLWPRLGRCGTPPPRPAVGSASGARR